MSAKKILSTKAYGLFVWDDNRPIEPEKHRRLEESIIKYGFLKCFPVVVQRMAGSSKLLVKDGQHRVVFAEKHGKEVWYIEEDTNFDVAEINCTAKTWTPRDYAMRYANNGVDDYIEGLAFASEHKIPVSMAFALLAGTANLSNCQDAFYKGDFKIVDRAFAKKVAMLYSQACSLSKNLKNNRFLQACIAACYLRTFDARRFLMGAARRRNLLSSYSSRDAYLEMMEDAYNYGQSPAKKAPLRIPAQEAMRLRNPAKGKEAKGKEEDAA